jgi:auxin-responsive protein IAA
MCFITFFLLMVLKSWSIGSNGEDHNMATRGERHSILLDGSSKFVLTYEDKEGDWMLVGDVPWG